MTLKELYTAAVKDTNSGKYAEAIRKLELLLTHNISDSEKADICALLGSTYLMIGNNEQGVLRLSEALSKEPTNARCWSNQSEGLRRLRRFDEAIEAARKALLLRNDFHQAHHHLAKALHAKGKLSMAIESYRQVLALNPKHSDAFLNMGDAFRDQGKIDEALAAYRQAIVLKPDNAEAHNAEGNLFYARGKLDDALCSYNQAISLKPDYAEAYNNKANTLKGQGKLFLALNEYHKAIQLIPASDALHYNLGCSLDGVSFNKASPEMSEHILNILEKKNLVGPRSIAMAAISLIKLDPIVIDLIEKSSKKTISNDLNKNLISLSGKTILLRLMRIIPIPDIQIEELLRNIRFEVLNNINSVKGNKEIFKFLESLSMQCFLNEYLYDISQREQSSFKILYDKIGQKLSDKKNINPIEIACIACYKPLGKCEWLDQLSIPTELSDLKRQQIIEPNSEINLQKDIQRLRKITDNVSSKVRDQYEENPYPRWVNVQLSYQRKNISSIIQELKIKTINSSINKITKPQILIAGCGTGSHPIGSESRYLNSNIVAVDLSLNSLTYAKRKTDELGIKNIRYVQGDILDLSHLDMKFDIIESCGVLHHMQDPLAGWGSLVDCLKPGGLMRIALYSGLARTNVIKIREEFYDLNIEFNNETLKLYRRKILESQEIHHRSITTSLDFYSVSTFRDLLFHVQEHRFTIPQIESSLADLGLFFCGFGDNKLISKAKVLGMSENDIYNLQEWQNYESFHPTLFSGMYEFWCQKI